VAESAAEALRALVRERPDLIVADIAIVEEDGYELLSRVRDRRRGQPCFSGRPGRQAAIVIVRD
jgi:CheY-like chemotaxis protein